MGKMQPIRKKDTLEDIEVTLSKLDTPRGRRMFLLWEVGIRTGMRISDMLQLRVGDLRGQKSYEYLPIKQSHKKGARPITITIEPQLRRILAARTAGMDDQEFLFASRCSTPGGNDKPISRQMAYKDMLAIGQICGLKERIGCHTTRKTFGYHHYQKEHDVAFLQEWFYHDSPSTTLIYIGITEDNFRKMTDNSPFGLSQDVRL